MAAIVKEMINIYDEYVVEKQDPRSMEWMLLRTPFYPMAIVALYWFFVLDWGPRIMKDRPPFKLDTVLRVYNILQIVFNAYIFERCLAVGWFTTYRWFCEPVDWSDSPHGLLVARAVWCFMLIKLTDLLDTVFFVLRKRDRQVSFLHLYHHSGMFLMSWIAVKYNPGGHLIFLGLINSVVHMVMYAYYFSVNTWPEMRNTWWKKYITQLQMVQFLLIALHAGYVLLMDESCQVVRTHALVLTTQTGVLTVFFAEFYYQAYIKQKQK